MSDESHALLEAFEQLPVDEKRSLAAEILRRSLPIDSRPLADEEVGFAAESLFRSLGEEDAEPASSRGCLVPIGRILEPSASGSERPCCFR